MEPASVLLARQLPAVHRIRGTVYPSVHRDVVAVRFMHHWSLFREEVLNALSLINLTNMVSGDSSEGDKYVVGNELGLSCHKRAGCYAFVQPLFRRYPYCSYESVDDPGCRAALLRSIG